jgi:SAM-dependent methyltransferase
MCHLTKSDVVIAIAEMGRVLQKGGFCFLGLMSEEAFPLFGEERNPGEFWMEENGEWVIHSVFSEEEAEAMLSNWEIIQKKKESTYHWAFWQNISLEKWMEIHNELREQYTPKEWEAMFDERLKKIHYDHIFYILRKPK